MKIVKVPVKVKDSGILYLRVNPANKAWFHAYSKKMGYGTASECMDEVISQLKGSDKKPVNAGTKKKSA